MMKAISVAFICTVLCLIGLLLIAVSFEPKTNVHYNYKVYAALTYEELVDVVTKIECNVQRIRFLVPVLELRNQDKEHDPICFQKRFGVYVSKYSGFIDYRMNRMQQLVILLIEAKYIVNYINGDLNNSNIIIAGFGPPWIGNKKYTVTILGLEYYALVDMISVYTSIPKRLLEVHFTLELGRPLLPGL